MELEIKYTPFCFFNCYAVVCVRVLLDKLGPAAVALLANTVDLSFSQYFLDTNNIRHFTRTAPLLDRVQLCGARPCPALAELGALEHLSELCLANPGCYDQGFNNTLATFFDALAVTSAASRLTVLEISANGCCPRRLAARCDTPLARLLVAAPALRTLDMSEFIVDRTEFNRVYAPCTRLTTLSVSLERAFDAPHLTVLATLRSLRSLTLHGSAGLPAEAYAPLRELPALASLALCDGYGVFACTLPVADTVGEAMAGLTRLTALVVYHKLSAAGFRAWGAGFLRAVDNLRLTLRVVPHWCEPDDDHLAPFRAAVAAGRLRAVLEMFGCACEWRGGA